MSNLFLKPIGKLMHRVFFIIFLKIMLRDIGITISRRDI